jgi:hypothetical protein
LSIVESRRELHFVSADHPVLYRYRLDSITEEKAMITMSVALFVVAVVGAAVGGAMAMALLVGLCQSAALADEQAERLARMMEVMRDVGE